MVLLSNGIMANMARLRRDLAPTLVHVGISTGHGALALIRRQVRVPWATSPGVRSVARAAIPLR